MIRLAREADVAALLQLLATMPEMPHWTEAHWLELIRSNAIVLVAEDEGVLVGCAVATVLEVPGETTAELETIVVAAEQRGRGLGKALLAELIFATGRRGAEKMLLEVRAGNARALELYARVGFQREGVRPSYYREPVEDAVLMSLEFSQRS